MKWLPMLVYVLSAPAIAGIIMIAVLTMPQYSTKMLIGGALLGFVIALPFAWVVSRKLAKP